MLQNGTSTSQPPSASTSAPIFPVGLTPLWTSNDRSETTGLPLFPYIDNDISMSSVEPAGDASTLRPSDAAPAMLSPNGVFNFSPAPSGPTWNPTNTEPTKQSSGDSASSWRGLESALPQMSANSYADGANGPIETAALDEIAASKAAAFQQSIGVDSFGGVAMDGVLDNQILMDLFWPGWPPNLPEPPVVNALVEVFFDTVPNMPRILHRARFLARMALPPTHSNFPHPALIHSICALAASWAAPGVTEGASLKSTFGGRGTSPTPQDSLPFGLRQAAFAKDAVQDGLNTGNRLFDVVRAMIILCRVFIDDTRMLECWTYCGLVSRMILPLGLNVRSAELSLKSVMLPPPVDALEREERRAVVWMAMYHDTIASAASGWGTSMALDELTVPLPVSMKDFEAGHESMDSNPQDLESLDLYIKHPVVDAFVMSLKGAVLLNRVNKFARKWKNRRMRDNDDLDGMQRPEFRELANAIACLQMSFPASLRTPAKLDEKNKLDVDLISAHVIPQSAIICLYEPFADITDPNDQPARRILNASQAIVGVVQQIAGTDQAANLGAIMHSSSSVGLVTAARTLLLFYRHALNIGDQASADAHRADIETARMALAQYGAKFKIGYHHAQLIEYFLDRATRPTFEKLAAHYPEHPRSGAVELTPTANFGLCIMNALNIKRGYWRVAPGSQNQYAAGYGVNVGPVVSPAGSTPGSQASAGSVPAPNNNNPQQRTSVGAYDSPGSSGAPSLTSSSTASASSLGWPGVAGATPFNGVMPPAATPAVKQQSQQEKEKDNFAYNFLYNPGGHAKEINKEYDIFAEKDCILGGHAIPNLAAEKLAEANRLNEQLASGIVELD